MSKELEKKKEHWNKVDKDNEYIMKRMHPAVILPGLLVGIMVIVGCIYKGMMGW